MSRPFTTLLFILATFQLFAQDQISDTMPSITYPYPVQHLTVMDSVKVAYIEQGSGDTTLLFIHGLGSNLKAWTKNIEGLKKDYCCLAVDLPGYGKSEGGALPYDMHYFSKAVGDIILAKDLQNVILVGHSMGGQIAIHLALQNHPKVQGLVLIAPAGFESFTPKEKEWFKAVVTPDFVQATPQDQIVKNFEINFHAMPKDARFMIEDRLILRETKAYEAYCQMIPKCTMGMLEQPVYDRLPEIALPTLVLFGANDQLIPNRFLHPGMTTEEVAKMGAERMQNSQVKLIPEAGHFLQWEQAEAANEQIRAFLNR